MASLDHVQESLNRSLRYILANGGTFSNIVKLIAETKALANLDPTISSVLTNYITGVNRLYAINGKLYRAILIGPDAQVGALYIFKVMYTETKSELFQPVTFIDKRLYVLIPANATYESVTDQSDVAHRRAAALSIINMYKLGLTSTPNDYKIMTFNDIQQVIYVPIASLFNNPSFDLMWDIYLTDGLNITEDPLIAPVYDAMPDMNLDTIPHPLIDKVFPDIIKYDGSQSEFKSSRVDLSRNDIDVLNSYKDALYDKYMPYAKRFDVHISYISNIYAEFDMLLRIMRVPELHSELKQRFAESKDISKVIHGIFGDNLETFEFMRRPLMAMLAGEAFDAMGDNYANMIDVKILRI